MSDNSQPPSRWGRFLSRPDVRFAFVVGCAAVLLWSRLGGRGLANYDDCFYAEKAKEILRTGDWLTMHYRYQPAWENSPFFMWLIALSYKVFGINEVAAKIPSAVLGVACVALVYYMAKLLFNEWTAFLSAFVLTTTVLFTRFARRAMMDVDLSFFVMGALLAVLLALRRDMRWLFVWAIATAVCILMKSVLGLFPLLIGLAVIFGRGGWKKLFHPVTILASILAIGIGGIWYVDQTIRFGKEFTDAHFGWLIVHRGFTLERQAWYEHFSYVEDLLTAYWPWLPFLVIGLWKQGRHMFREDRAYLLTVWVGAYLIIMSLMQSRVFWYILPALPACAIVVGAELDAFLRERWKRVIVGAVGVVAVLGGVLIHAVPIELEAERESGVRAVAPIVRSCGEKGYPIIAFRHDYYGLNNALQFYSDFAGYPIYDRYDSLAGRLRQGDTVVCVLNTSELEGVQSHVPEVVVLKRHEEMAVIGNHRLSFP